MNHDHGSDHDMVHDHVNDQWNGRYHDLAPHELQAPSTPYLARLTGSSDGATATAVKFYGPAVRHHPPGPRLPRESHRVHVKKQAGLAVNSTVVRAGKLYS